MSVLGGPIKHLHDDLDLSFQDLKTIFLEISTGKKPVTEKIDGFKAFFTFLPDSQALRIATTKKDVEKGGLIVKELKNILADNENFAQALTEASEIIENRLKSVSITEQRRLFGYRGDIFYTCEILHPTCNNVFAYDNTKVVVHRSSSDKQNIQLFEQILGKSDDFCVNPARNLDIFEGFATFKGEINEFMKFYGLKSTSTIGDFVASKLTETLAYLSLPEFNRKLLIKKIMNKKGTRINYIRQHLTLEQLEQVDKIISDKKRFLSEAMVPIKNIINNNSINILDKIESNFIPNIEIQSQSIKENIKENPLFENIDFENFSIKNEGIVFEHNDKVYKLTGHFAEINKVLGYTGGDKEVIIERPMRYCFIPGKFKPPHAGHLEMIENYSKDFDEVYVLISNVEKESSTGLKFTAEQSKKLFEIYQAGSNTGKVRFVVCQYKKPLRDAFAILETKRSGYVAFGTSTKGNDGNRFNDLDLKKYLPDNFTLLETNYEVTAQMDATDFREAISESNIEAVSSFLPEFLQEQTSEVIDIFKGKLEEKKTSKKSTFPSSSQDNNMKTQLKEVSSMAGGNVAGDAGSNRHQETIIREEFIEELRLRETIRKVIVKLHKGKMNEEKQLRDLIRKLILETKTPDNDPAPNRATGINVLEDLLKKIIPIIETDFKKLTTKKEQRDSYRAHIVNGTENLLKPVEVNDDAADEEELEDKDKFIDVLEEDDLEEDITVKVDDKFIDIEPEEEPEEEDPLEKFGIEGTDLTGRNVAYDTFKRIETNIIDAYDILGDDEDQDIFFEYLLTNLKLYFDKFEEDLMATPDEPSTDSYDEEGAAEAI